MPTMENPAKIKARLSPFRQNTRKCIPRTGILYRRTGIGSDRSSW